MIVKAFVYTLSDPGLYLWRGAGGRVPAGELQRQDGPADPARLLGRRRRGQGSHGLMVTERSSSVLAILCGCRAINILIRRNIQHGHFNAVTIVKIFHIPQF